MTLREIILCMLTAIIVSTGFMLFGDDHAPTTETTAYKPVAINKRAPKKKEVTTQLYNPKKGVELVDLKPTLKAAQDALSGDDGCALRAEEVERVQVALKECDERFDKTQDELEFLRDDYEMAVGVEQIKPVDYPEAFEKQQLEARFLEATEGTGFQLTEMDCSEFPCILVGKASMEEIQKGGLGRDFFEEHFSDAASTSSSFFSSGDGEEAGFALTMYPPDMTDVDTYELDKRLQVRKMKIQEIYAKRYKAENSEKEE